MNLVQFKMITPIGLLYLIASAKGLKGIYWSKQEVKSVASLDNSRQEEKILDDASRQLAEYFAGTRKSFNIPFDLEGTPFQIKVWNALSKIPYGQTAAYQDIARNINNSKAVRAVGSANGKNPLCIMIPCHRVITSAGTIGGYAGGINVKRQLLALEGKVL